MMPTLASEGLGLASTGVHPSCDGVRGAVAAGVPARVGAGEAVAAAAPLTATDADTAGSVVIAGVVAASAVAVSVTDVTATASEATGICACIWYSVGVTGVARSPIVQVAVSFPLGHRLVNSARWPAGAAVSVTVTPDAGPFSAETSTVNDAVCPRLMLDFGPWTLTHSSAGDGGGVGLVAGDVGGLKLPVGPADDGAAVEAEGDGVPDDGSAWH